MCHLTRCTCLLYPKDGSLDFSSDLSFTLTFWVYLNNSLLEVIVLLDIDNRRTWEEVTDSLGETCVLSSVDEYDLAKTLTCGQFFRYRRTLFTTCDTYVVQAADRVCSVSQASSSSIQICFQRTEDLKFWEDFFNLSQTISQLNKLGVGHSDWLSKAIKSGYGIRILHQPAWEALITFIISQNNSMFRIRNTVHALCSRLGESICGGCYSFPSPSVILEADLGFAGLGYRDSYLKSAADAVLNNYIQLDRLISGQATLHAALTALQSLPGVGPKVASCVALYGLRHMNSFPIDVWMKRALLRSGLEPGDISTFGESAGLLQQYMFYFITQGGGSV